MKIIFEYEEQTTGHVCDVGDKEKSEDVLAGLPKDLIRKDASPFQMSVRSMLSDTTLICQEKILASTLDFIRLAPVRDEVQPKDK